MLNVVKAVILAGGLGTRISEETYLKPKPMVEIGGKPILWHIMKIYSEHGINDFIVCCGYKGYAIKEYFSNYYIHTHDIFISTSQNKMQLRNSSSEDWNIQLVDTGLDTLTGGRLKRVKEFLDDTFCFTYGDGVADINLTDLISFHKESGKKATLTAVKPPGRYGALEIEGNEVKSFEEKPDGDKTWINGGFFVLEPSVIDLIDGDTSTWEDKPLMHLASANQLNAYKHRGFWQPMDTLRDRHRLEELWSQGKAPWNVWS